MLRATSENAPDGKEERYHCSMRELDVDTRLSEWARWCRSGRFRKSRRCQSAEGLYRAPPMYDPPPSRSTPANIDHVLQVEDAVVALLDPFRMVLVAVYVQQTPPCILQRRLRRWRVCDPQSVLAEARRRVAQRLGEV
jgi:hypothetical protein